MISLLTSQESKHSSRRQCEEKQSSHWLWVASYMAGPTLAAETETAEGGGIPALRSCSLLLLQGRWRLQGRATTGQSWYHNSRAWHLIKEGRDCYGTEEKGYGGLSGGGGPTRLWHRNRKGDVTVGGSSLYKGTEEWRACGHSKGQVVRPKQRRCWCHRKSNQWTMPILWPRLQGFPDPDSASCLPLMGNAWGMNHTIS